MKAFPSCSVSRQSVCKKPWGKQIVGCFPRVYFRGTSCYLTREVCMTKLAYIFFLVCLSQVSQAQMGPSQRFLHESLMLGEDLKSVTTKLHGIKEVSDEQTMNPFLKKDAATFYLSYTDTIFGKHIGVSLSFSKQDSLLESIMLIFLELDPKTGKTLDESVDALWDSLSAHFGVPQKESSLPFVGKKKVWQFSSVEVQMLRLKGATSLLTVTYSRPN